MVRLMIPALIAGCALFVLTSTPGAAAQSRLSSNLARAADVFGIPRMPEEANAFLALDGSSWDDPDTSGRRVLFLSFSPERIDELYYSSFRCTSEVGSAKTAVKQRVDIELINREEDRSAPRYSIRGDISTDLSGYGNGVRTQAEDAAVELSRLDLQVENTSPEAGTVALAFGGRDAWKKLTERIRVSSGHVGAPLWHSFFFEVPLLKYEPEWDFGSIQCRSYQVDD